MTKEELEAYVDELEGAIESASDALEQYNFQEAKEILDEYTQEPEEGEEPEEEEKGAEE